MPARRLLIDANLLVLLVVGQTGRELIAKHRRLTEFSVDHYDRLLEILSPVSRLIVTPNTLTETSNLLAQHKEPERTQLLRELGRMIERSEEITVASSDAARSGVFPRLGLTDAVILDVASASTPVLTVDLDLFVAAWKKEPDAAVNFRHIA